MFTEYLLPLNQKGYYSTICGYENENFGDRYFPLPSFYVETPNSAFHDTIPPSPIRDLQLFHSKPQTHADISISLNFTWTAPGNDFNHGRALYYKIYCGYTRENLSYHHCKSISETIQYANPAGKALKYVVVYSFSH